MLESPSHCFSHSGYRMLLDVHLAPFLWSYGAHIYSIRQSFMWIIKNSLITWSELCRYIKEGDLGSRDLKVWNLALLAKAHQAPVAMKTT